MDLEEDHGFHKHLTKTHCLMIGIGGLIGGGIFSIIGVISAFTGPYSYISYFFTGVVALITVYSYHKLTSKWCTPGGEYSCVQYAFFGTKFQDLGPFIGILLYFGYIVTMALYAYTFSVYFILIFGIEWNFFVIIIIIILLILFFTILNLKGVKESAGLQSILVIIKVIILVLFIILGLMYAFQTPNQMTTNVGLDQNSITEINFVGIMLGSACILISYEGFQLIAYNSHEMEETEGGLKMMHWSLVISMILYCLVGFTAIAVLGATKIVGENPHDAEIAIAIAALNFMGTFGMLIIILGALLSTASALNATMLGSSRLAFMMSKDRVFPERLSKLSKNKVPYVSIIITGVLSIVIAIITGGALAIAGMASLIFAQIFFIINFTNFKKRKTTNSNAIIPLLGMFLTAAFFIIYLIYIILNFEQELFSLITFLSVEGVALLLVYHIKRRTSKVLLDGV